VFHPARIAEHKGRFVCYWLCGGLWVNALCELLQYVGMGEQGQGSGGAVFSQARPKGLTMERCNGLALLDPPNLGPAGSAA